MLSKKLKFLLLAVITFFGAYYFFKKGSEFVQLIDLSIQNIFFLSIAVLLSYFFYGFKLKNLCDPFDIHLPAREWIGLPMILHLGNLIFFKAGTVTLAIYLKNHYQLPYTKFVAIMTAEKTFLLYSMCLLGLAFTFLFDISSSRQIYSIIIFCTLITILTWIFFYIPFRKPTWNNWTGKTISKLIEAWDIFKNKRLDIIKLIGIQAIVVVCWGFRFFMAFHIINADMSLITCLGLALAVFFTGLINLIPGALGIREVTVGIFMSAIGLNFHFGVFAVTVDRILSTLWFAVLGVFFLNFLHLKRFEKDPKAIIA